MLIIVTYIISAIAWGYVLIDMIRFTALSIRDEIDTPRLLVPLSMASLALFVESAYFLVANIFRHFFGSDLYLPFLDEEKLFVIKLFIAVSGVLMMLKVMSERKSYKK